MGPAHGGNGKTWKKRNARSLRGRAGQVGCCQLRTLPESQGGFSGGCGLRWPLPKLVTFRHWLFSRLGVLETRLSPK